MKRNVCLSAVVAVLLMGTVVWSQSTAAGTRQGTLEQGKRSAEVVAAAKRSGWIQDGDDWDRNDGGSAGVTPHLQVRHDGLSRSVVVANDGECEWNGGRDIQLRFGFGNTGVYLQGWGIQHAHRAWVDRDGCVRREQFGADCWGLRRQLQSAPRICGHSGSVHAGGLPKCGGNGCDRHEYCRGYGRDLAGCHHVAWVHR